MQNPVSIGVLGCGAVADYALFAPVNEDGALVVAAVAARDVSRAEDYAKKYDVPRALTYDALIADPDIESIYIAVPNSLHLEWAIKALEAGKAVLCEKPLASNADEAQQIADAVVRTGGILVDAVHPRFHPLADRMRDIVANGDLGEITGAEFEFIVPGQYFAEDDIRFQYGLAGGATMDVGYYGLSFLLHTLGADPDVVSAAPTIIAPDIDGAMKVELKFPGGCKAIMDLSLVAERDDMVIEGVITGTRGRMTSNPVHPYTTGEFTLEIDGQATTQPTDTHTTYVWQARAFAENVRNLTPVLTTAENSVRIMRVIDDIYRAAGMKPRGN
ncbi:MAG: Gfo/Idh/MocA family oxidoreductase [Proteobacteria bacterium]|nr:Gfo/Idh/MocA family oxidoreductase [Pseudomonadota bacterium]